MGMASAKPLYTLNIKVISEVKGQTRWRHIKDIYKFWHVLNIFKLFFFENSIVNFHVFIYIDNKVTTLIQLFYIDLNDTISL